eukprot:2143903-Rhodomonas_salina.1
MSCATIWDEQQAPSTPTLMTSYDGELSSLEAYSRFSARSEGGSEGSREEQGKKGGRKAERERGKERGRQCRASAERKREDE